MQFPFSFIIGFFFAKRKPVYRNIPENLSNNTEVGFLEVSLVLVGEY